MFLKQNFCWRESRDKVYIIFLVLDLKYKFMHIDLLL